ncbi:Ig-like domain-containing protein [Bradyrhizobium sp. 169]|uniref:Ig-like domain-containing protein n=1 Tax=Bradyrhizobium sp. 169 TaxID=2782640 RepID=UPI001FF78D66|nr:Ig-like domain-containing protein [Bradyrhizobium sp. 169]MCK1590330.1 cadherin-like domain-containing protein [Bradyrhizobium sp. 169]
MTTYWVQVDFNMERHEYGPGGTPTPDHEGPLTFLGTPISTPWVSPSSPFTLDTSTRWANVQQGDWQLVQQPNGLNYALIITDTVEWDYTAAIGSYFIVGTQPAPVQLVGPTLSDSAEAAPDYPTGPHNTFTLQWTDWVWEQITVQGPTQLFTSTADTVNFNSLLPDQQSAIASGADLYNALGGGDTVTLPNANPTDTSVSLPGTTTTFDLTHSFVLGDKTGDITNIAGSDGSYNIALGAGSDTVTINGAGTTKVAAGSGVDTLSISGGGTLVVNGNLSGGSATIGANSILELRGADSGTITFSGANATLKIDGTLMPTGVLTGLAAGDKIDLAGVSFDNTSCTIFESGNTLEVDTDQTKYSLQIDPGSTISGGFSLANDGSGHLQITYLTGPVQGEQQIDPHSAFGIIDYSTSRSPYNGAVHIASADVSPGGSGFIIGSNAILTSAHVIQAMLDAGDKTADIFLPSGQSISFDPHAVHLSNGWSAAVQAGDRTSLSARENDWAVIYTPTDLLTNGEVPFVLDTAFSAGTVNITGFPSGLQNNQIGSVSALGGGATLLQEQTEFSQAGESGGPLWISNGTSALAVGLVEGVTGGKAVDVQLTSSIVDEIDNFLTSQLAAKVGDGYISGATVFADANNNGQIDSGEASTTTNATGGFSLAGGSGPLIAFGGTDSSTGLPFKGPLSAPSGSNDITPLTTLLTDSASDTSAQQKVLSAFGLSSSLDLTTFDPIAAAQGGSADGAATEVAGAKVYDTVEMIASALAGAGSAFTSSLQAAFAALASALDGAGINLGDKTVLSALITQVAETESVSLASGVADSIASIIAAGNAALDDVLQTDQPGAQLLSDVAGVELVMQGAASSAITNAAGSLTQVQGIANLFTGTNLDHLITQAQTETQNPGQDLGPIAFNGSATTDQNTVLNGTASAVDLGGNAITYALDGSAPAGLTFKSDGTFTFDPGSAYKYLGVGESTKLSFQFTASDGPGTDSAATETITINGLNDNPIAAPDSNGVAKGKIISVSAAHGVLANDSDPDLHDQLAVVAVNGQASSVGHPIKGEYGSLTLNADGSYAYVASHHAGLHPPHAHHNRMEQDAFNYTVSDGHGGSSTSTVTFDVAFNHGHDTFLFRPTLAAEIPCFVHENTLPSERAIFPDVRHIVAHTIETMAGALIPDGHGNISLLETTAAQLHNHDFHFL